MLTFEVNNMTCGHCVSTITQALKAADPGALVQIDLPARRIAIEPSLSTASELSQAISEAGYTPVVVSSAA